MTDGYDNIADLAHDQREVQLEPYPFELTDIVHGWAEGVLGGDAELEGQLAFAQRERRQALEAANAAIEGFFATQLEIDLHFNGHLTYKPVGIVLN